MKLLFDESDGTPVVAGDTTLTYYPNNSFTLLVNGIYTMIVYTVQFLDKDDKPTKGTDAIYLGYDGQEYRVVSIYTHDGLSLHYKDQDGKQ